MSDLLAPLLAVMDNEVDTFWCFVGFMDMVVGGEVTVEPLMSGPPELRGTPFIRPPELRGL